MGVLCSPRVYFFLGTVFFTGVFLTAAFGGFALVAGAFLALAGDFAGFAAFGLGAATFFAFLAAGSAALAFFGAFLFLGVPADFAAAGFLVAGFFAAAFFLVAGFLASTANLKCPDAPVPLTCTNSPLTTAAFRNFLMNGASLAESTL